MTQDSSLASFSSPASTQLGDHTHLTIPEPEDEDGGDVVKQTRVPNPFITTSNIKVEDTAEDGGAARLADKLGGDSDSDSSYFEEGIPFRELASFGGLDAGRPATDGDDTSSNWDDLEEVQKRLEEYGQFKQSIGGHEKWTAAQEKMHKLIALRGSWPMLERSWAFHFTMRNIFPSVYAPGHSRKRVAIGAKASEFRAVKSLETIFDLSPLVSSLLQIGNQSRIGPTIRKTLKRHIDWAMWDAGLAGRAYLPTLQVYEYDIDSGSDDISDGLERRLRKLAAKHRRSAAAPGSEHLSESRWQYQTRPPLLFAFVVVQHMVMVVNLDSAHPDNEIIVFTELNMSEADQWLWNALAIALPVHAARDAFWEIRNKLPLAESTNVADPDL